MAPTLAMKLSMWLSILINNALLQDTVWVGRVQRPTRMILPKSGFSATANMVAEDSFKRTSSHQV